MYEICFLSKVTVTSVGVMAPRVMDIAGEFCRKHQLTRDPAMNPVMVLATFDGRRFLANNVSIMATHADISMTIPTEHDHCQHETELSISQVKL